jgi:hypothetical protein
MVVHRYFHAIFRQNLNSFAEGFFVLDRVDPQLIEIGPGKAHHLKAHQRHMFNMRILRPSGHRFHAHPATLKAGSDAGLIHYYRPLLSKQRGRRGKVIHA